jgi:hypothetical protein
MKYHKFPLKNPGSFTFDLCKCFHISLPKLENCSIGLNGDGLSMVVRALIIA